MRPGHGVVPCVRRGERRRGITRFAGRSPKTGETAAKPKASPRSREVRRRVRVDRGFRVVGIASSKDDSGLKIYPGLAWRPAASPRHAATVHLDPPARLPPRIRQISLRVGNPAGSSAANDPGGCRPAPAGSPPSNAANDAGSSVPGSHRRTRTARLTG